MLASNLSPWWGRPPLRGLNRLLIRRLIGENIQSSPARPAGATPSYGWPLVNQPFIGMVGPWLTIYSFIWGVWLAPSLVWLDLACTSSLTQNRQGLNSNHFPSQIYIKYAFSCLKTDVALVGHKNLQGLDLNLFSPQSCYICSCSTCTNCFQICLLSIGARNIAWSDSFAKSVE